MFVSLFICFSLYIYLSCCKSSNSLSSSLSFSLSLPVSYRSSRSSLVISLPITRFLWSSLSILFYSLLILLPPSHVFNSISLYSLNLSLALPLSIPFYLNIFVSLSLYSYLISQYSIYALYIHILYLNTLSTLSIFISYISILSLHSLYSSLSPTHFLPPFSLVSCIFLTLTIQFLSIYSNSFSLKNSALYLFLYVFNLL